MSDEADRSARMRRFEDYPLTRTEYITAMVHFYRAEVARSTAWRQRLDATTNWAVLTTAGMLSLSFSSPESPHFVVLLTSLVILAYLGIEARRFRYFAVYRARVRMIEENFLLPIVTRRLESPMDKWGDILGGDLDVPKYKTTFLQAFAFRLRRNYVWIFAIVLGGWLVKLMIHPKLASNGRDVWERIVVGHIPPVVVITTVVVFHALLFGGVLYARHVGSGEPEDEIAGLERDLRRWKA